MSYPDRFTKAVNFVLKWETSYSKGHFGDDDFVITDRDPDDFGGATRYGIDARSHKGVNIDALTKDDAIAIYYKDYWQRFKCEEQGELAECWFNCCVNCGSGRAAKILAAITSPCGCVGGPAEFLDEQDAFYRRLAAQTPRLRKFLKGWGNRTNDLRRFLGLKVKGELE